jgi:hypothetical protein
MSVIYTHTLTTKQFSASSDGLDLEKFLEIDLNVNGTFTTFWIKKYLVHEIVTDALENDLPENWIENAIYDSIEFDGEHWIFTLSEDQNLQSHTVEEIAARYASINRIGVLVVRTEN